MTMLIDRLIERIKQTAPIVVGLDPRLSQIPGCVKEEIFSAKGKTPQAAAEIIFAFNKAIIDQIHDIVPAVKPQIAMYEQFGAEGFACYLRTVEYAKSKGLIVIGDVKRGDIASTAEAYSNGHIGQVDIDGVPYSNPQTDFITVNPYMGYDSVQPYLADCKNHDKGLFVLVKTSNPSSKDIQDMDLVVLGKDLPMYMHVGNLVSDWGKGFVGKHGYSAIGAVVGATHPEEAVVIRKALPHTFFLVPGYGAQGGSGKDLKDLWTENFGAIVNNSRGITGAYQLDKYKSRFGEKDFAQASRQAVLDMKADLEAYM